MNIRRCWHVISIPWNVIMCFWDVGSDIDMIFEYHEKNETAFRAILAAMAAASFLCNSIGLFLWWFDNPKSEQRLSWYICFTIRFLLIIPGVFLYLLVLFSFFDFFSISFWPSRLLFVCLFQGALLLAYAEQVAALFGPKETRKVVNLREKKLDISKGLLQSIPQITIQGFFFARLIWKRPSEAPSIFNQIISFAGSLYAVSFEAFGDVDKFVKGKKEAEFPEIYVFALWRPFIVTARITCIIMIVLAIREYGAFVWILLFAAHIFVTLCHIWMQVNLEELKWQDFSLIFLNVLMHIYSPINMMTKSNFFRYMIGYLIEFAENIACIAFWCSAVKFDFPYKVVVAIVVFLLNIIGLVLLIVRLRYFSRNEDEEDRRGSSSVPLTTFLKSPALND